MKFKTDENLPLDVTNMIKRLGHDCLSVRDQNLGGCSDVELIEICSSENRILVTLDLDFSDIRRYAPNNYAGIIVIRDAIQTIPRLIELTSRAIFLLQTEPIVGLLWIVEESQVRIRGSK